MKKVLILLGLFILMFVFDVKALEYYTINVTTFFEENIEISEVPLINLYFYSDGSDLEDDNAIINNIVELKEDNNYSALLNDTYIYDQTKVFAMVDKDNLGKYNCELKFTSPIDGVAQINIVVTLNTSNSQDIEIPKDILESIYGKKNNSTTTNNGTDNVSETTTNNQQNEIIIKENEKKEQQKQEKEGKLAKNNKISLALFIIIGIILLFGIIFIAIKFAKANK